MDNENGLTPVKMAVASELNIIAFKLNEKIIYSYTYNSLRLFLISACSE